jgi:hypothetical protein
MAINDSKKPLLLGMSTEEVIQSSDANFTSLFDSIDDLDQNIKNSGFVTKDVDNLVNYTLKTKTGTSILLSIDKDYVMTLQLKNEAGTVVSTSSVDFPIESMIIDASYSSGTLTLTLQNGNSIDVDISAIISGLVPDSRKVNNKPLSTDVTLTQDDIGEGTSYKRYSSTEKTKLAGIDEGANRYVHPSYTERSNALYKITVDNTGHISEVTPVTKQDITALGIPAQDTQYPLATESTSGLMSSVDKKKLNAIDPSLEGVTADEIGKVKDVTVNGTSVLGSNGTAAITIDELKSGYVSITTSDSRWTTKVINGTTYHALKVEKTNTAIEVYNSNNQKIVAQNVFDDSYLYICVGTAKIACTLRTMSGSSVGGSIFGEWSTIYANSTDFNSVVRFSDGTYEIKAYSPQCSSFTSSVLMEVENGTGFARVLNFNRGGSESERTGGLRLEFIGLNVVDGKCAATSNYTYIFIQQSTKAITNFNYKLLNGSAVTVGFKYRKIS